MEENMLKWLPSLTEAERGYIADWLNYRKEPSKRRYRPIPVRELALMNKKEIQKAALEYYQKHFSYQESVTSNLYVKLFGKYDTNDRSDTYEMYIRLFGPLNPINDNR